MLDFERVKAKAKEKQISMVKLSGMLGKNETYFYDVRNKNLKVSKQTLEKLAEILDTSAAYLNGETDDPTPYFVTDTNAQDLVDVYRLVSSRPTTKILFSALKDATDEDIQQCLEILKALKATNGR